VQPPGFAGIDLGLRGEEKKRQHEAGDQGGRRFHGREA
jgi:hypothetical protein